MTVPTRLTFNTSEQGEDTPRKQAEREGRDTVAELRNAVDETDRQRPRTMEIGGYRAVIQFDPDIEMFRGEFVSLNGGADFYARDVSGLRREGAMSLRVFLEMCEEEGSNPGGGR